MEVGVCHLFLLMTATDSLSVQNTGHWTWSRNTLILNLNTLYVCSTDHEVEMYSNAYKHDTQYSHLYGIKLHIFYPYHINVDASVPSINPILLPFMCKTRHCNTMSVDVTFPVTNETVSVI